LDLVVMTDAAAFMTIIGFLASVAMAAAAAEGRQGEAEAGQDIHLVFCGVPVPRAC
jgi:hypothetical protein